MELLFAIFISIAFLEVLLAATSSLQKPHTVDGENSMVDKPPVFKGTDNISCGVVPKSCEVSKYRSFDGSCNNLERPWYGMPNNPYRRILPNSYSDGIHQFPKSVTNEELPNVRTVSMRTYVDVPKPDKVWTLLFMQYGQIIAHDLSLTSGISQTNKQAIVCCSNGQVVDASPRCAPIIIPQDDPYNAPEGIKCMDFLRTETTQDGKICTGATEVAEPLSKVTAYLDLSFLYGNNKEIADSVRKFKGGKLNFVTRNDINVLPQDPDAMAVCDVGDAEEVCYYSGDVRVNQNPELAILQNIYMQYHNVIADEISRVNPHWDDERLFQETRRILIAQHQRTAYYHFFTVLIGEQYMNDKKVIYLKKKTTFVNDYDPKVNPAVSNEFAAAIFRGFHTEIVGNLKLYTEHRNVSNCIDLYKWFNKPSVCEHGKNFYGLVRGLITQAQSAVDRFISNDVLNLLFKGNAILGLDLKAIDTQRGRDHGVPSYVQILYHYGLLKAKDNLTFKDLTLIDPKILKILESLYARPEDVDLSIGSSLETTLPDALSGPTARAIMTEQMLHARTGDRCFFENGIGKCAFTVKQYNVIKNFTIAQYFCATKSVQYIQADAFKLISKENPLLSCDDIPKFDPEPWREEINTDECDL